MPYIKETCISGRVIEERKYFSPRFHPKGEKRVKKEKPTKEEVARVNHRNAEIKLRRLMNTNFKDGDFLVRLDFFKRGEVSPPEMQKCIAGMVRELRKEFLKRGLTLKYIYVKEIGPSGSRHIHILLPKCDTDIIMSLWKHGGVHIDPLNSGGQYRKVAAYFIKYADKSFETSGKLAGKRWYGSRNLEQPKIEKKIVMSNTYREQPRPRAGYYVEPDSIAKGVSEFTGYGYFFYSMVRLD